MRPSPAIANRVFATVLALAVWLPGPVAAQVRVQTAEAVHTGGMAGAGSEVSVPVNVNLGAMSLNAGLGSAALKNLAAPSVTQVSVAPGLPAVSALGQTVLAAPVKTLSAAAVAAAGILPRLDVAASLQPSGALASKSAPAAGVIDQSVSALAKAVADPKNARTYLSRIFDNSKIVASSDDEAVASEENVEGLPPEAAAIYKEYASGAAQRIVSLQQKVKQFKTGEFGVELVFTMSQRGMEYAFTLTFAGKPLSPQALKAKLASGELAQSQWQQTQNAIGQAVKGFSEDLEAVLEQNQVEQQAAMEKMAPFLKAAPSEQAEQAEPMAGMPPQAVAMHKEYEAAAAKRLSEVEAEIGQAKVGRFGVQIQQQQHERGIALVGGITFDGKPLTDRMLKSLIKSGVVTEAEWTTTQQTLEASAQALIQKVKAVLEQNDREHDAVHRSMAGLVQGVYRTVRHADDTEPEDAPAPNLTEAHLDKLYDKMIKVQQARQGSDAQSADEAIPQEDAMRLGAVLTYFDKNYAYPIAAEAWDKAVEVMGEVAAKAFGVFKSELQADTVAQAAEAAAKSLAGEAKAEPAAAADPAKMDWSTAVTDMLKAAAKEVLDSYGAYWNKEEFKKFMLEGNGAFIGIGVSFGKDGTILRAHPGSPAEKAGIQAGDKIVAVDGTPVSSLEETGKRMRGKEGTSVRVQVERNGQVLPEFTMVRTRLKVTNVAAKMVAPDVGYVQLGEFTAGSGKEVFAAITQLREQGAKKVVWDLRLNPGGNLDDASSILASFFKDGQRIVSFKRQGKLLSEMFADGDGKFSDMPLVILVNEGSASASEVSASALQDVRGPFVVGSQSYGKGIMQVIQGDHQGRGMRITHALWYSPNDRSIDGKRDPKTKDMIEHTGGVTPDHPVVMTKEQETAVLKQVFEEFHGLPLSGPRVADPVLEKALEVLSNSK